MAEVRVSFADWVIVDRKPGIEHGDIEQGFGLCKCVEWVCEVVNVESEWRAV